jgi:hypothetical protein
MSPLALPMQHSYRLGLYEPATHRTQQSDDSMDVAAGMTTAFATKEI